MNNYANLFARTRGSDRLFGLDLMRACSIIMVFLSHSTAINPLDKYFPYFGWAGFGVEAFFVLSGFLIGRIILRTIFKPKINWSSIKIFWISRWLRTIPAYLFVLSVYYIVSSAPRNTFAYLIFGQTLVTPIPHFFVHSWSLAVEEWFYILFPITLLVISRLVKGEQASLNLFLTATIFFIVFGLVSKTFYHIMYKTNLLSYLLENKFLFPSWKIFLFHGDWDNMRKILPFRIDAIAYGCLIAYLVEKLQAISKKCSISIFIVGILGLVLSFRIVNDFLGGDGALISDIFLLPLFCISFSLLIPYALICPKPNKPFTNIITKVSQTSYSFYLIHVLILDLFLETFVDILKVSENIKWMLFPCAYISVFVVSYLMYRLIELPFLNYRKKLVETFM